MLAIATSFVRAPVVLNNGALRAASLLHIICRLLLRLKESTLGGNIP